MHQHHTPISATKATTTTRWRYNKINRCIVYYISFSIHCSIYIYFLIGIEFVVSYCFAIIIWQVFVLAVFIGVVAAGGYEGQGYKEKNQYEAPSYSNPPGYPPYVNNYYNNPRYSGDYVNQGYQANQYGPGKNYYAGAPYAPKKYAGSYGSDSYGYKNVRLLSK